MEVYRSAREYTLSSVMNKVFEKFRKNIANKDNGTGWYLQSYTDTLQRDDDKLDVVKSTSQQAGL